MSDKSNAPLLDDYVFKRTFTRDDPNGILKDFLEAILKIKLKNVQVLNAEVINILNFKEESKKENEKKMKEIINNLKKMNISDEQICQILNITEEKLRELIEK